MAVLTKKTALLGVLLIAGVVAAWKFVWKPMQSEKMAPAKNEAMEEKKVAPVVPPASNNAVVVGEPKTGTLMETEGKRTSVRTSYKNPGGSDEVAFTLTVDQNGVITDAVTEVLAVNPISKVRQEAFAKDFPAALKGKKLAELTQIDRVGGSSLTTGAFNTSLAQLQAGI